MSIIKTYIVPHPPLIIPEIEKGILVAASELVVLERSIETEGNVGSHGRNLSHVPIV